jgi:hypothetical protein
MRTITKTYKSNTYEYTLKIVFTDNLKQYLKKCFVKWGIPTEEAIDAAGVCLRHPDNIEEYVLIYNYSDLTDNCIQHEIQHLACFILDDRNIGLKGENDDYEPLCWLNGELSEVVREIIVNNKIPIIASNYTYKK